MNTALKGFLGLLLLFSAFHGVARAEQKIYMSESPNGKFRIVIKQLLYKRVGDRIFFQYPIVLENVRNPKRHFTITEAGDPLVKETERQTFKMDWDYFQVIWAKDSQKCFFRLRVLPENWKTFFVDVEKGVKDITAELQTALVKEWESHQWTCQEPKVELVKWTKPHLAFLKLTSTCGKHRNKENSRLFFVTDSVLFDAKKGIVASHCIDCKEKKAEKRFDKYFKSTLPTPTPTPEETPVIQ
jgi:hypothetical protein